VRENVIVAYRGANYELGQWPYGYGIWNSTDQEPLPLEWWDPTPEGWSAAWYRFAALEAPGTITPVSGAASAAPANDPAATGGSGPAGPSAAPAPMTSPGPADNVAMAPATPPGRGSDSPAASGPRPTPFFAPPAAQSAEATGAGATAPGTTAAGTSGAEAAGTYTGPAYAAWAPAAQGQPAAAPVSPTGPAGTATAGAAASPLLSRGRAQLAAALLAAGVVLGVIGLFPSYSGSSLASQAADLWPHLIYLAGWAAGAVLIFRGGALQRTGALLATGLSVVTLGLFLADAGFPIADGSSLLGAGLVLSLIGWAACAAGSVVAFGRWPAGWPRRPIGPDAGVIAAIVVAAIGVAVTFAPAWDKITLSTNTAGTLSETLGNAFSNPGAVIAGDVLVMLGLVAVVAIAVLWRPARLGWALIAGAMIPMAAQIVAALAQLGQTTTAADLGITPAQAAQLGISTSQAAHTSLTVAFWLYCLFVIVLLIGCAWLAFGREEHAQAGPFGFGRPAGYGTAQPPGQGSWPGAPARYAAHPAYPPAGYQAPAGYRAPAGYPGSTGYPAGQVGADTQTATAAPPPSSDQVQFGRPAGSDPIGPNES
jgi:hypothetical protein